MQKRIVITGGPGTGKTMVINELIKRNYFCKTEISRQVTSKAREKGIDQLFLEQPLLFSEMLLEGRVTQFTEAKSTDETLVFFDRGVPDVLSYMDYSNTSYPKSFIEKCNTCNYSQVFLMPPWEDIYTSDSERYENYQQSVQIYTHIKKTYAELGYQIIEVPKMTVNDRVDFILNHIS